LLQDKKRQVNSTRLEGSTSETRVRQIEREFCEGVRGLGRGQKPGIWGNALTGVEGVNVKEKM